MPTAALQIENIANRTLEIVKTGTMTASTGSGGVKTTVTLAHNLGFTPVIVAFVDLSGIYIPMPTFAAQTLGTSLDDASRLSIAVDATNIYLYTELAAGIGFFLPYVVRYYLLKEVAK